MALNLTTPTVRPPSSLDLEQDAPTRESGSGQSAGDGYVMNQTAFSIGATNVPDPVYQTGSYQPPTSANRAEQWSGPVQQFAMDGLNAPSRFDSSVVQQGIDLVNQEMDFSRGRAEGSLDEFMSQRGLTGSSVESRARGDMLAQLEIAKSQRLNDLTLEMARTYGADRTAAGQMAMQTGQYLGALDERDINEARYGSEFQRLVGRDYESDLMNRAGLDIQAGGLALQSRAQELQMLGMTQDEAYRYARMEQEQEQFQSSQGLEEMIATRAQELQAAGMQSEEAYRQAQLYVQQQQIQQQADIANQQAGLSAQDMYLRAVAAGAGDFEDVPTYDPYQINPNFVSPFGSTGTYPGTQWPDWLSGGGG